MSIAVSGGERRLFRLATAAGDSRPMVPEIAWTGEAERGRGSCELDNVGLGAPRKRVARADAMLCRHVRIVRTTRELCGWRDRLRPDRRVALVPTMGALHGGHVSLLDEARRRVPNGSGDVVMTIFLNPTQFDDDADLDAYPRDEARDLEIAGEHGVDLVFAPATVDEMYPFGRGTWVEVNGLDALLCGATRPGHFRGVCTVVAKLWGLTRPHLSVFGEKDYQQLAILRRLNAELFLRGEVIGMPIVRASDGLALSSRNARLGRQARSEALAVPRLLRRVRERFEAGEREVSALLDGEREALAPGRVDYVEIVDADDLRAVSRIERPALCAVAASFGGVRLIDNTVLRP